MNLCPNCQIALTTSPEYLPAKDGMPSVSRYVCRCGAQFDTLPSFSTAEFVMPDRFTVSNLTVNGKPCPILHSDDNRHWERYEGGTVKRWIRPDWEGMK